MAITFKGKITTSGSSEAIRLEKNLFKMYPEFSQKSDVIAQRIAPGHLLVSIANSGNSESLEEDPIFTAFISFLAEDMEKNPQRMQPLSRELVRKSLELTNNVTVEDDETIPDEITL